MDKAVKDKQLTLRMPEDIHKEFKVIAAKKGRAMGELLLELIREYIRKTSDPR
jgi:predicted DNA-binding protein